MLLPGEEPVFGFSETLSKGATLFNEGFFFEDLVGQHLKTEVKIIGRLALFGIVLLIHF
jgi:hypothetical protein